MSNTETQENVKSPSEAWTEIAAEIKRIVNKES